MGLSVYKPFVYTNFEEAVEFLIALQSARSLRPLALMYKEPKKPNLIDLRLKQNVQVLKWRGNQYMLYLVSCVEKKLKRF